MSRILLCLSCFVVVGFFSYSQECLLSWANKGESNDNARGNSIVLDALGNSYITGYFLGSIDIDPGLGTQTFVSPYGKDMFIQN